MGQQQAPGERKANGLDRFLNSCSSRAVTALTSSVPSGLGEGRLAAGVASRRRHEEEGGEEVDGDGVMDGQKAERRRAVVRRSMNGGRWNGRRREDGRAVIVSDEGAEGPV